MELLRGEGAVVRIAHRGAAACHALDAAVYARTVNDAKRVRDLVETGIGGIISDDPRLLSRTLRQ